MTRSTFRPCFFLMVDKYNNHYEKEKWKTLKKVKNVGRNHDKNNWNRLEVPPFAGIANQRLIDHCLPDGQEEIGRTYRSLSLFSPTSRSVGISHTHTLPKTLRNQSMHHLKLMAWGEEIISSISLCLFSHVRCWDLFFLFSNRFFFSNTRKGEENVSDDCTAGIIPPAVRNSYGTSTYNEQ